MYCYLGNFYVKDSILCFQGGNSFLFCLCSEYSVKFLLNVVSLQLHGLTLKILVLSRIPTIDSILVLPCCSQPVTRPAVSPGNPNGRQLIKRMGGASHCRYIPGPKRSIKTFFFKINIHSKRHQIENTVVKCSYHGFRKLESSREGNFEQP